VVPDVHLRPVQNREAGTDRGARLHPGPPLAGSAQRARMALGARELRRDVQRTRPQLLLDPAGALRGGPPARLLGDSQAATAARQGGPRHAGRRPGRARARDSGLLPPAQPPEHRRCSPRVHDRFG